MAAEGHLFNNISLGGHAGANPGHFRVHCGGITWKQEGGGKTVDVDKSDIAGITWMKIPKSYQLGVQVKDGLFYKFIGFRDQDVSSLKIFVQNKFGSSAEEKQLSINGHTWGGVDLSGNMLTFLVGSKQAFNLSLADVSQAHLPGKNDIKLEFPTNVKNNKNDLLEEIIFHIPDSNTEYVGDEDRPPAQVFHDKIMSMADVGVSGEDAVVTFESVSVLTPRGRYTIELHLSFFKLQGQAMDFKIQYSSVARIFMLPKCYQSHQSHTFVVVTLDPPIRKGQTSYPHIVLQFESDLVFEDTLSISEDLLNTRYKDKLEPKYKEFIPDVFTKILRGLSGAKVTKSGRFRSHQQLNAVKSSLKTEDGLLYPLEMGFFFLPKPPTLILNSEVDYVEFRRHGTGGNSMQYFDLLVILKNEQEHVFGNIQKIEYDNLLTYIREKNLNIMNLGGDPTTGGSATALQNDDDASDEEDDDFVAGKDDDGSPTDDSGGEESDASLSGGNEEKPLKEEPRKEASTAKLSSSKKRSRGGDGSGTKKGKPRKKKDPNAPKKPMSGFMFFSQNERDNVRMNNPGIAFTDVARALGEKGRNMTDSEKEPFEAIARVDQKRYKEAIAGYTSASHGS